MASFLIDVADAQATRRFVSTDAPPTASTGFQDDVSALQLDAALLLHAVIAQGSGLTPALLHVTEVSLVQRLFSCIQSARLDIQGQLLLTLHEVIRLASRSTHAPAARVSTSSLDDEKSAEALSTSEQMTSFLLQTLVDGLSVSSNLPVLPEWTAFIIQTVPLFRGPTRALLSPLSDCLAGRVARIGDSLRLALEMTHTTTVLSISPPSDAEITAFLEMLEPVAQLAFLASSNAKEQGPKGRSDSSAGLRSYVAGVFGGEGPGEEGASNGRTIVSSSGLQILEGCTVRLTSLPSPSTSRPECGHSSKPFERCTLFGKSPTPTPSDPGFPFPTASACCAARRERARPMSLVAFTISSQSVSSRLWPRSGPATGRPLP